MSNAIHSCRSTEYNCVFLGDFTKNSVEFAKMRATRCVFPEVYTKAPKIPICLE